MQDMDFIKGFTDMPFLVRTDTLQYLDPRDVVTDYQVPGFLEELLGPGANVEAGADRTTRRHDGVGSEQEGRRCHCTGSRSAGTIRRAALIAALTGTYRVKLLNGREIDVMPIYQMYLVHLQDYDLDTCIRSAGRRKTSWSVGRVIPARSSRPRSTTAKGLPLFPSDLN